LPAVPTVIVGVDGSGGEDAALELAAEEARVRDARLRVVSVCELAPTLADPAGGDFIQGLRAPADAAARAPTSTSGRPGRISIGR
jgi:nucleotide-binding universal stress UspA family protein